MYLSGFHELLATAIFKYVLTWSWWKQSKQMKKWTCLELEKQCQSFMLRTMKKFAIGYFWINVFYIGTWYWISAWMLLSFFLIWAYHLKVWHFLNNIIYTSAYMKFFGDVISLVILSLHMHQTYMVPSETLNSYSMLLSGDPHPIVADFSVCSLM